MRRAGMDVSLRGVRRGGLSKLGYGLREAPVAVAPREFACTSPVLFLSLAWLRPWGWA